MPAEVTQLLNAIEQGDPRAADELLPLVYEELRKLAASKMAHETPGQTLQATALVHEAWLRLAGAISRDTMTELFRCGEVLPEGRSTKKEEKLIAE